jgi:glycosyltransferase involved in cell wall biosynthesis
VLHTLHGPFTEETSAFYARHAHKASAVALSRYQAEQAPEELEVVAVIGNPIVVDDFPFRAEKDDYLLWIGRLNDDKGPQRAIAAAREADAPLVLAGPVQPGQEEFFASEVEPHVDGERIRYVGEVGDEKVELYAGARALLMPIRWAEPFGLVMTEAMACGTPVIAFPEGSAPEIVRDGLRGRRRARDGRGGRAARRDRPRALPRERARALRRQGGGRGLRGRLRRRRPHWLTALSRGVTLRGPWHTSIVRAVG